ncbi:MAG: RuBisCO chaperone RbcX [Thainema sp.]
MNLKSVAKETAKVLSSYLTYQALKTVVNQLRETNPPLSIWLHGFSPSGKLQDGELYLEELLSANPELAFRIMTVRQHLAEEIAEYLPEMVQTGIQQANIEHRRRHLERITQLGASSSVPESEQLSSDSSVSETDSESSE